MKELVCIVCPRSCKLQISDADGTLTVTGNTCKRGYDFAVSEMTDPKRTLCTTVKTAFPDVPVLPVRTAGEIPKAKIFAVMEAINHACVTTRLGRGDVVLKNVLALGVDVIATSGQLRETKEGTTT